MFSRSSCRETQRNDWVMPQLKIMTFVGLIIVMCLSIWRLDLIMETVGNRIRKLPPPKTMLTPRVEHTLTPLVHPDGMMPTMPSRFQLQSYIHSSPSKESSYNEQSRVAFSSWTHGKDYCIELIQGTKNATLIEWAAHHRPTTEITNRYIDAVLRSCDDFLRLGDYIHRPVNFNEERFPLAYAILVYRDPAQVERLLHAIYRPQNYYCVHVDSKVSELKNQCRTWGILHFTGIFIKKRMYFIQITIKGVSKCTVQNTLALVQQQSGIGLSKLNTE